MELEVQEVQEVKKLTKNGSDKVKFLDSFLKKLFQTMADHEEDKCESPVPGPMAFTVDFGDDEGKSILEKKKLALRDSIRRFTPAKIKTKLTQKNKDIPNNIATSAEDNTNHVLKNEVIIDEENNIKHNNEPLVVAVPLVASGSDAGTYTIEDDEDQVCKESSLVEPVKQLDIRNKEISRTFGIQDDKLSSREWVSMWASNSFAEDNPIEEEDLDEGRSSSQRRRLPPTPLRHKNGGYNDEVSHTF